MPLFSVIIPTYNRIQFLPDSVESVLRQTYSDWELLVSDDGSTDDTADYLARLSDPRIRVLSLSHGGVSRARNRGIYFSRGRYIAFLDSDDRFEPDKLHRTARAITHYPDIPVFHSEERWFRNGKLLNQKKSHRKPDGWVFERALSLCCISPSTAVVNAALFNTIGVFDERLPACEDYDFWLRVTCRYPVKLIPEILTVKSGGHSDQLSKRYPAMDWYRIQSIDNVLRSGHLSETYRRMATDELHRKAEIYIAGAEKRGRSRAAQDCRNILTAHPRKAGPT